ncbi:MAG: type I-D CRISPR-associated protein Cas7/Csc2 [Rubrobacteraceae bacterium]|nr:type I-D CRISPR-associated protein Cas7/Csc2 [Rubrobacteraceae bacterium]
MTFKSGISREFESETKTVIVSAVLETTGHVRFGDGTDINVTVTEKDVVAGGVEKVVFAGTKRRGVDRRTMHELRNKYWELKEGDCFIPALCGMCPICLLLGFTGTTSEVKKIKDLGVNCKSRILYATAYSVQPSGDAVTTHSRNQVNERSQTTAGSAGIHTEEVIVAGTVFPTYTTLHHVLDWEIGAFAHAFLENVSQGRYTAASRAQGGMRFAEANGEPMVVVDVSESGVFPIPVPKVPASVSDVSAVKDAFIEGSDARKSRTKIKDFGFSVEERDGGQVWKRSNEEIGSRFSGEAALAYLRKRQGDFLDFMSSMKKNNGAEEFRKGAEKYFKEVSKKKDAGE